LRLGIEGPDRFKSVAEEVKANRLGSRRIEIEDAAAHRVLAWIGHGARASVARNFEPLDSSCMLTALPAASLMLDAAMNAVGALSAPRRSPW
jgi:hypothetical protein